MDTPFSLGWGYRKQIIIDHTKVAADQTNFPVLINTIDPNWKSTGNGGHVGQTDGGDLLFTSADGSTKYDYDLEKYDPTTGEVVAWVRVPTLSSSTDTTIGLYYGNAGAADQWNPTGVWAANYNGVWHLGEGTSTAAGFYKDATSNAKNGTLTDPNANTVQANGRIGKDLNFNGDADYIDVGSDLYETDNTGTISAWVKLGAENVQMGFFDSQVTSAVGNQLNFVVMNTNQLAIQSINQGSWNNMYRGNTALDTNWHYVTVTSNGSAWTLYVDGVAETLTAIVGTNTGQWFNDLAAGTHSVSIGRQKSSAVTLRTLETWTKSMWPTPPARPRGSPPSTPTRPPRPRSIW